MELLDLPVDPADLPSDLTELPPVILKGLIGRALRNRREQLTTEGEDGKPRKLLQEDIAEIIGCKREKITHLESGRNMLNRLEAEAVLRRLDCLQVLGSFLALISLARKDSTLAARKGDPAKYGTYAALEEGALRIDSADLLVLHGLLQTPATAEVLIRTRDPEDRTEDEILEALAHRVGRKAALHRDTRPLHLSVVIAQGVIEDLPGPPETRREQLEHLLDLGELPNIDLRVRERGTGIVHRANGPFIVMTLPGNTTLVYVETKVRSLFFKEADEVDTYRKVMADLEKTALPWEQSKQLIEHLRKEIR